MEQYLTLNKNQTAVFFKDKENGYQQFIQTWKSMISEGFQPTVQDMMLYAIVRGKNINKSFAPVKKPKIIECQLNGKPFGRILTWFTKASWRRSIPEKLLEHLDIEAIREVRGMYSPEQNLVLYSLKTEVSA